MKFSIKDFFSKCDLIRGKLQIWSYLLTKSLMKNFIFCAVTINKFNKSIVSAMIHPETNCYRKEGYYHSDNVTVGCTLFSSVFHYRKYGKYGNRLVVC